MTALATAALRMLDEEKRERKNLVSKPWGYYKVLESGNTFQVKIITLNPHSKLSYQSHKQRSEYWIVVEGQGKVVLDDIDSDVRVGDTLFVPTNCCHRIINDTNENLQFIEVQIGTYLGEDDITRYEDDYGRV